MVFLVEENVDNMYKIEGRLLFLSHLETSVQLFERDTFGLALSYFLIKIPHFVVVVGSVGFQLLPYSFLPNSFPMMTNTVGYVVTFHLGSFFPADGKRFTFLRSCLKKSLFFLVISFLYFEAVPEIQHT